jgi:hypothetical protein
MRFDWAQVISWLSSHSADFATVCLMAGLEPEYVRTKAKEAIARGCAWRKDELKNIRRQKRLRKKLSPKSTVFCGEFKVFSSAG